MLEQWLGVEGVHCHGVTFNLRSTKCVDLPYLRHISLITKICGLLLLIIKYTIFLFVLFPLTAIIQILNFTDLQFLSY